jgi:hypothetical protein
MQSPSRSRRRIGNASDATLNFFTVVFYGLTILFCKTTQLCVTLCERYWSRLPSVRNDVQRSEKTRKNSLLNYESPALTAELQARRALTREHPTANVQRPIFNR